MRGHIPLVGCLLLAACGSGGGGDDPAPIAATSGQGRTAPQTCTMPAQDCMELVIRLMNGAKRQVLVQGYDFNQGPLVRAMVAAKKRGVDARALIDRANRDAPRDGLDALVQGGVPVSSDPQRTMASSKVMIIDGDWVITGEFAFVPGFNLAADAGKQPPSSILVMGDPSLAADYAAYWRANAAKAKAYVAKKS